MRAKGASGRVNWHAAREEYVTGSETFAELAARLEVNLTTVEWHASARVNDGQTWGEQRVRFRTDVSSAVQSRLLTAEVAAALVVREAQSKAVAALVDAVFPLALAALKTPGALTGYEAVKTALALLAFQRRVHGLDAPLRLEVTGNGGRPIEHDVSHGVALDFASTDRAQRALEALFGNTLEVAS
jgi:hypothetical protein